MKRLSVIFLSTYLMFLALPAQANESKCYCALCCGNSSSIAQNFSQVNQTVEDSNDCKLSKLNASQQDDGGTGSVGFPRLTYLAPSLGKRNGYVLHVDFPDAIAKNNQIMKWNKDQIPTAENLFTKSSFGKYKLNLDASSKIYRLSKKTTEYNLAIPHDQVEKHSRAKFEELVFDAMTIADSDVDFSKYDFIVIATPKTKNILLQGTMGSTAEKIDGVSYPLGILAPYDAPFENGDAYKKTWLAHNIGHVLGLMHGFISDFSNGTKPPAWDIMDNFVLQNDFMGWNKWKLGWLNDSQIFCVDEKWDSIVTKRLTPMGQVDGGLKMIVIKLDNTTALAIEVRMKMENDTLLDKDGGVLVYKVDISKGADQGAYTIVSNPKKKKMNKILGTMGTTEAFIVEGFAIKVYKNTKQFSIVSINKSRQ